MKNAWLYVAILLFILFGLKQVKKHQLRSLNGTEPIDISEIKVFDDIAKARKLLGKQTAGSDVLLAIKKENGKIETIHLAGGTQSPQGYVVHFPRLNGVNTRYEITSPADCIVLALKRAVRANDGYKEVVYTPYTKDIDTPELRQAGLDYIKDKLDRAQVELHDKSVRSFAYGGRVADAIPKDVALTLAVIEHIDPARFNARVPIEQLIGEVLVVLATNRENAYRYSVSKAGARGQFQFMPKTYAAIDRRYPKAELIDDFGDGMDNHVNAAKASLLLFDSDLSYLPPKHRMFLKKHPEAMGKYLAAAYNGGPGRAQESIQRHASAWESHVLPETRTYLKEFEAVWKFLHT